MNKHKIINDPVYGFLSVDNDLLYDVISHPWFQRQRHIRQLGFTYLVYPGAVHSRFSHMLGALNLMKRAIEVLRTKGVEISDNESLGVQLAILLHDVGHGPFSHTSERTLVDVHHETLTRMFMERMNADLGGGLETAIAIFTDSYPRHFLHQLVSSQLDMDRLDYLARDSFFTGVSEGIVGTERIINMLNVKDDTLVVDEKGIYSIEKFIISRRLMYWQVYLHKTVIAADNLFYGILRRVRILLQNQKNIGADSPLFQLLKGQYNTQSFLQQPQLLDLYASIDDSDILAAVKTWQHNDDSVLARLSSQLISRQLPAIKVSPQPFDASIVKRIAGETAQLYDIDSAGAEYFVGTGQLVNHAYSFDDSEIKVLFKDGRCIGISEASDQLDRHFLEKTVRKYYVFYPKGLMNFEL